jgi:hypothetical protein
VPVTFPRSGIRIPRGTPHRKPANDGIYPMHGRRPRKSLVVLRWTVRGAPSARARSCDEHGPINRTLPVARFGGVWRHSAVENKS